jgi:hypothetical protein
LCFVLSFFSKLVRKIGTKNCKFSWMISFGARLLLCGIKVVYSALQGRTGPTKAKKILRKTHAFKSLNSSKNVLKPRYPWKSLNSSEKVFRNNWNLYKSPTFLNRTLHFSENAFKKPRYRYKILIINLTKPPLLWKCVLKASHFKTKASTSF